MTVDKRYCMSSFLMYRRVVDPDVGFSEGRLPRTIATDWHKEPVSDSVTLEKHIRKAVQEATADGKCALALSGGIDSAILAKMMPPGATAYTFRCTAGKEKTVDETDRAAFYAKECGLKHKIVEITWDDMQRFSTKLMQHKCAPIHSIEVQIYMGGLQAKADGFERIIYCETADVNYGGLNNILSKDWRVGEFVERYAYLKPWLVLRNPKVDFSYVNQYVKDGFVDLQRYLSEFDIMESINSYINACETAGIGFVAPYADTYLDVPLDYMRIRRGDSKYLIREIFERLYPNTEQPVKIPMPRATDQWLKNWAGPTRPEFWPHCTDNMTGDQKWLVWALERFLNMIDSEDENK